MFCGESDDRCLFLMYTAELKCHSQATDVARMQNTVLTGETSLVR